MTEVTSTDTAPDATTDVTNKETNNNDKYTLQSVKTALSVLDLFFEHEEISSSEAARYLGINRSTAFRFLVTLEQCGYVTKTASSKYRLSAKVSALGQIALSRMELINLVHPYLCRITQETGETSHLATMNTSTHITFIDKCVGTSHLIMDVNLGYTVYAHFTGTGKAILAYESDQFINEYIRNVTFEEHTEYSIKDAKQLLNILDKIRKDGYACDSEETEYGLTCYAVPILSANGSPLAAISSSGPTTRMIHNKEKIIPLLQDTAEQIQKHLTSQ